MEHKELKAIINADEKVLWQGKPNAFVYMTKSVLALLIPIAIILLLLSSELSASFATPNSKYIIIAVAIFVVLGPLYSFLVYPFIQYVITDKRIILQKGLIGRDFDFVDYDKIENASVNVGLLDKILGRNTGSISIFANRLEVVSGGNNRGSGTRNVPFVLSHVMDPYGVFAMFKKTSYDIKSDLHFPNALRPEENKGYTTDYNLPKKD